MKGEIIDVQRRRPCRPRVAEAEGYALKFGCVSGGEFGAMGLHYVNFPLVLDGELDPTRPEIGSTSRSRTEACG